WRRISARHRSARRAELICCSRTGPSAEYWQIDGRCCDSSSGNQNEEAETYVTRLPALLLWCIVVAQLSFGAESVSAQKIDDIFAGLKSADAPGAAVLVIKDGKPMFQQGYGVTDLRTRNKIDEHTNFRLASVSKQFTA